MACRLLENNAGTLVTESFISFSKPKQKRGCMTEIWKRHLTDQDLRVLETYGFDNCNGGGQRPALLVIDMTYKFLGDRDEPIEQAVRERRTACGNMGWRTIPATGRLLDAAHAKGVPVIYTRGVEPQARAPLGALGVASLKNVKPDSERNTNLRQSYQIIDEIAPGPNDIVVEKQKPSAFLGTPLTSLLIALRVDSLYLTGCATGGCVRATAVDAFSHNYRTTVVEDCCFDRFESSHAMALFDLGCKYAEIANSDAVIGRIGKMPAELFASERI